MGIDQSGSGQSQRYKSVRGLGGFVRADWDTAQEIIAAANAFTVKKFGPDRVVGFLRFRRCPWCLTPLVRVTCL
jgi:nitrate reductase alpha subunit